MNRKLIISIGGFILLVVAALIIFKIMTSSKKKEAQVKDFLAVKYVETEPVIYKDYNADISVTGRLIADQSIDIYSEVSGIMDLSSNKFKVGNSFKKGQTIIKIIDDETRLTYLSQKSEFLSLLTSIMSDIKIDYPESFDKWNRYLSKYSIESPIADLPIPANDKEKFFIASRKVFQSYYNLKNMEVKLSKYTIPAPVNGTVIESLVESGTLIRLNQKLGRLSNSGTYELELTLSPDNAEFVKVGSTLTAVAEENGKQFQGRIIRISRAIDPATQTIKAYASLNSNDLYDGMYMKANIKGDILRNVISINRKAIVNNQYVYLNTDNKLDRKTIEIVKLGDNIAYIRGLNNGDEIINDAIADAVIGMKVESIKK